MDQNEKLVHFGVTHVAAIDGYSSFIVGHVVMSVKNNVVIYEDLFRYYTPRRFLIGACHRKANSLTVSFKSGYMPSC